MNNSKNESIKFSCHKLEILGKGVQHTLIEVGNAHGIVVFQAAFAGFLNSFGLSYGE